MANPPQTQPKVLITGASGMLGRALHRQLFSSDYHVKGLGFSRLFAQPPSGLPHRPLYRVLLQKLNLLDYEETSAFLQDYQPDIIVHCAAERFPDAFETKLDESIQLNVDATKHLANECLRLGDEYESRSRRRPFLIYISTSYVFDGGVASKVYPPYKPDSRTNPINSYGESKWDGECVIRDILNKDSKTGQGIISDEATAEPKQIDDWALRFPTSVEDVAKVLKLVIIELLKDPNDTAMSAGTYHVASPYGCTKYELLQLQSNLMKIPGEIVEKRAARNSDGPPANSAPRPQCTQLDCSDTWKAIGKEFEFVKLQDGMSRALHGFPNRFM